MPGFPQECTILQAVVGNLLALRAGRQMFLLGIRQCDTSHSPRAGAFENVYEGYYNLCFLCVYRIPRYGLILTAKYEISSMV